MTRSPLRNRLALALALVAALASPAMSQAQTDTCNADPVIAGNDFTDSAWDKSGWQGVQSDLVFFAQDDGDASLRQYVSGVTPGAIVTFTWSYTQGIGALSSGHPVHVRLIYNGVRYWSGYSAADGSNTSPASTAENGATCLSGCSALAPETNRTVRIRLPTTIPANGNLNIRARVDGTAPLLTPADDPAIHTPVTITNTGICLAKRSLGGTGTFAFGTTGFDTTMGGGGTTASIATTAAGALTYYDASATRTQQQPLLVLAPGGTANVSITETPAAGFTLESVSCPGLSPVRSGDAISIANVPLDSVTTCTFTNRTPIINLRKALAGGRVFANDQFSVAIRTGGANGTVVSSTTAAATTGSGATVAPGSGTTGDYYAAAGTSFTLTEASASGGGLANYSARLTCTDSAGVMPAASLPNDEPFNPATGRTIVPTTGADLRCVITNTPNLPRISGRVFLDNGRGGGTANDGISNGTEEPLAGTAMRLTNCAGTVHASTLTDASGNYRFGIPASLASGASLCVEQTDGPARISTGASVGTTALPSGTATSVGGTSYVYTRTSTPDRIAFQWNGASHAGLNFGDVNSSTFAASGARTGPPGSTVSFAHVFTAGTAGAVRFSIASETSTPPITGWNTRILADTGCTGQLQPGAAQLYPPQAAATAVAQGGKVCIVVQQFIPSNAPEGALHTAVVRADFDFSGASPAVARSFTLQDTTTVSNTALELLKEVRNLTQGSAFGLSNQARPGEMLEYRITYTNNAEVPIHEMTVSDTTPAYTRFVLASAGSTPATLSDCNKATPANPPPAPPVPCADVQSSGGTGPISWAFTGTISPGAAGAVLFRVKVD